MIFAVFMSHHDIGSYKLQQNFKRGENKMIIQNANQILFLEGIDCQIKKMSEVNGRLTLEMDKPLPDEQKKVVADIFFLFRDVTIL